MGKVKSAFEIAMEKSAKIELTPAEKEKIKDEEKIKLLLTEFYRGDLEKDRLLQELKNSKPPLLREVQLKIVDSLGLKSSPGNFQQRMDGIIAIETLKKKKNITAIKSMLNSIKTLQKKYEDAKEKVAKELEEEIESNPQLRMHPMRTPDGRTVMQAVLSVEEAVQHRDCLLS